MRGIRRQADRRRSRIDPDASRFAPAISPWRDLLGQLRDVVRQELVTRQLREHLPEPKAASIPLRVLDAGCGQGTQALRLARLGFQVVGVDLSPELLSVARAALRAETAEVQARVVFQQANLLHPRDWTDPDAFDVVCCHGVVMYQPALGPTVKALAWTLRPGGLLSIYSRNRASIAMRAGMLGHWSAALAGFDARHYANRLGIADARADDPAEVRAALDHAGIETVAWYGVRLFTDHWSEQSPPEDVDALLAAE